MRAGRMRHPITFERRGSTQNSIGQQVETWSEIGSGIASIDPVRGRDYFNASGEKADVTHEIRTRAQDFQLLPRDRVMSGDRRFDIRSVLDVSERGREWVIMCVEVLHTRG